mmetsp:Transcript_453/g.1051  ORF Transcript_453/g.1051 Transcript_453/m.1051 type:complete len:425 (+) Transcript_453:1385-2659(+)
MFDGEGVLEPLQHPLRDLYKADFDLADEAIRTGRVEETTRNREKYWEHWVGYCKPLGLDPYVDAATTTFQQRVRAISGFAARVRTGYYGNRKRVAVGTVRSALTAIGQKAAMDRGINPIHVDGGKQLLFPIQLMLDGWRKVDPPTTKKLPVEVDIVECMANMGRDKSTASACDRRVGDLGLVAFYYLLRVGEYAATGSRKVNAKQTTQFRWEDVTFFYKDGKNKLKRLPVNASPQQLLQASGATLRLTNQKNGWKNVCIHQQANGEKYHCPVRALARIIIDLKDVTTDRSTFLSTYCDESGTSRDVTDKDMRRAIKFAAVYLDYPGTRGIAVEEVDTHSLRAGGANALHLSGVSDTKIQKMGRWRSDTFKEYISDSLSTATDGLSTLMKHKFNFVSIAGKRLTDITDDTLSLDYDAATVTAQAA